MEALINRQAAIDAIYTEFKYVYCYNCGHETDEDWCEDCHRKYMKWSASLDTIERVLNNLPTTQVDKKKAEWIEDEEQHHIEKIFHCSKCGFSAWGVYDKTRFCGGCGEKMENAYEENDE